MKVYVRLLIHTSWEPGMNEETILDGVFLSRVAAEQRQEGQPEFRDIGGGVTEQFWGAGTWYDTVQTWETELHE